jgi:hypothetical protein
MFIADIGGYTRFMKMHRTSLAHAQDIVSRLLEAVVDASSPLRLVEIEGDAAFLYSPASRQPVESAAQTVERMAIAMHWAFHRRQQEMVTLNDCPCEGCRQIDRLRLKFVAHLGEVAEQRVRRSVKPGGLEVIFVHRMLKNAVPVPEYLLMSEAVYRHCDPALQGRAHRLEQELEGIGTAETYFVDLAEVAAALPPAPERTTLRRQRETLGVVVRSLPYLVGLKKACLGFRNLAWT